MKKAAIISLYGNENYGNKLQNYAVQEILKQQNLEVDNIINIPLLNNKNVDLKTKVKRIKFFLNAIVKKHFNNIDCNLFKIFFSKEIFIHKMI